jgi:hypothetical protein
MSELQDDLLSTAEGFALVESADGAAVQGVLRKLATATGAEGIHYSSQAVESATHLVGHGIDVAQGIAFPLATALIFTAAFKHMLSPFMGNRKRGRG